MQWPTLSHSIEKTELPGKDRSARLAIRQVRLNSRTLFALQLTVEIQRQPSTYVFTTSQNLLLPLPLCTLCVLCVSVVLFTNRIQQPPRHRNLKLLLLTPSFASETIAF